MYFSNEVGDALKIVRTFLPSLMPLPNVGEAGDTPLKNMLDQEALEVFRLCIELPSEVRNPLQRSAWCGLHVSKSTLCNSTLYSGESS